MANYFTVTLDTTGPRVEIIAPMYTIPGILNEIYVIADEPLLQWQELYVIDSAGLRYDMVFAYQDDHYYGLVDFQFCNFGIATIYAQLKDEVGNISALVSKAIEIQPVALARVEIENDARLLINEESVTMLDTEEIGTDIDMEETQAVINMEELDLRVAASAFKEG